MHIHIVAGIIATSILGARADLCALGSTNINGNEYCQAVEAIRYSNVGQAGIYNDITNMTSDGTCSSQPFHFSGPLSPLDEEVSLHFRGPVQLKQLAVYTLSGKKKRASPLAHRRHQHYKLHKSRDFESDDLEANYLEVNDKREIISATIDGTVVSWDNNYSGTSTVTPVYVTATIDGQVVSWLNNWFGPATTPTGGSVPYAAALATLTAAPAVASHPAIQADLAPPPAALAPAKIVPASGGPAQAASARPGHTETTPSINPSTIYVNGAGIYKRIGYYDSTSQTVDNLVFLGNYGGETGGSGVSDLNFGASLAYANNEGTSGAASPQVLNDCIIPSDKEIIVMMENKCEDGDSCGYVRPGTVAHHGFPGADKMFLVEFSMPHDTEPGFNADMPAIWILNAKIPRTLQYGNSLCSCWDSGCGEVDIAETLHSGSNYLKSAIHTNEPAADSDYFERPTSNSLKLAVIFRSADAGIHIEVLPDSTSFSSQMTTSQINTICNSNSNKAVSHFQVG